jgi:hypothetical protein
LMHSCWPTPISGGIMGKSVDKRGADDQAHYLLCRLTSSLFVAVELLKADQTEY